MHQQCICSKSFFSHMSHTFHQIIHSQRTILLQITTAGNFLTTSSTEQRFRWSDIVKKSSTKSSQERSSFLFFVSSKSITHKLKIHSHDIVSRVTKRFISK